MSLRAQAVWVSPFPGPLAPFVFVAVLRFSVRLKTWNSTEFLEVIDRERGEERRDGKLVFFILADVIGHSLAPREICR